MRRQDLTIETPCQKNWDGMKPADMKKRFCDECKMHVHDLAAMTKREAKTVLAGGAAEGLCIRYLYDQHGDVVFSDDPRLVAPSALVRAKRFAFGAVAIALPLSLTACMGAAPARAPAPMPAQVAIPDAPVAPAAVADGGVATPPTSAPLAK